MTITQAIAGIIFWSVVICLLAAAFGGANWVWVNVICELPEPLPMVLYVVLFVSIMYVIAAVGMAIESYRDGKPRD